MGRQFKTAFLAHFKSTFREKQVWFWAIMFPVLLMVVFLTIFGGSSEKSGQFEANVAIVMEEDDALAIQIEQTLKYIPVLKWHSDQPVARDQAEEWIKNKKVDAIFVLPNAHSQQVELLMNQEKQNSVTSQVLHGILNEAVIMPFNYEPSSTNPPIQLVTEYMSASERPLKFTDFLLTGMIALSLAQSGLFGMMGLVEMRRNGLLRRLKMTPMKMSIFGLSDVVVRLILAAIQIVILTMIGLFLYGANLQINFLSLIVIFTAGTLSFAGIGYMIAAYSRSIESYSAVANLVSFVMMFLSGIFFDISTLPSYIKPIANFMPLTYFANGIRDSMVYGVHIFNSSIWINAGIIAVWGVVAFIIGSTFYSGKKDLARVN